MSQMTGHRGADPRDAGAFAPPGLPALRSAVSDLAWLLGRGYAPVSSLKLVGDRWALTERQRMAVRRSACSEEDRERRRLSRVAAADLAGKDLWVDGFNVLTTLEAWLGGGLVIYCRDGTFRDIVGIHNSYRPVVETLPAIWAVADRLEALQVDRVRWLFDRPVSNSGRIRALVEGVAARRGRDWSAEVVDDPDPILARSSEIVATADSGIIDAGPRWFNLVRDVIEANHGVDRVLDLSDG